MRMEVIGNQAAWISPPEELSEEAKRQERELERQRSEQERLKECCKKELMIYDIVRWIAMIAGAIFILW